MRKFVKIALTPTPTRQIEQFSRGFLWACTLPGGQNLTFPAKTGNIPFACPPSRDRCPHRLKVKGCAGSAAFPEAFGAGPSGGNILVPVRTLGGNGLIRPRRRQLVGMFRVLLAVLLNYSDNLAVRSQKSTMPSRHRAFAFSLSPPRWQGCRSDSTR